MFPDPFLLLFSGFIFPNFEIGFENDFRKDFTDHNHTREISASQHTAAIGNGATLVRTIRLG